MLLSNRQKTINLTSITPGGYALPETAQGRAIWRSIFKAGPTHEEVVFRPVSPAFKLLDASKKRALPAPTRWKKADLSGAGFSPYEGTMAPGTYWMPLKADGKTLIAQMQEEFAQMVKKLPSNRIPKSTAKS